MSESNTAASEVIEQAGEAPVVIASVARSPAFHETFFAQFGTFPIKWADGVFTTLPVPTVEELYQAFRARLDAELEAESLADSVVTMPDDWYIALRDRLAADASEKTEQEGAEIAGLLNRLAGVEAELDELKAGRKPKRGAASEAADTKAAVELASQDKHPVEPGESAEGAEAAGDTGAAGALA